MLWDNELQFDSKVFRRYCRELGIKNRCTPAYPQENGQAEAINKTVVSRLKIRLDDVKGRWVDELPHVLWTYRTTQQRSTEEMHFSMTYGSKAIIRLEVDFPTLRTDKFSVEENDRLLCTTLELINERREVDMVRMTHYQQKLK